MCILGDGDMWICGYVGEGDMLIWGYCGYVGDGGYGWMLIWGGDIGIL